MKFIKQISKHYYILAVILLLGLGLRLINIGAEPYWGDEILSLDIVKHFSNSIPTMLQYLREVEVHPPLYYLMMRYWIGWFGESEAATRSLSLIFGLGIIALTYYLGYLLFKNKKTGLIAAFIVAILPIQIEYSQEARPYIIFCFFGILATISLWKIIERYASPPQADQPWAETKRSAWRSTLSQMFGYVVFSLAGLYLHYSYFFILAATSSFWLVWIFFLRNKESSNTTVILGSAATPESSDSGQARVTEECHSELACTVPQVGDSESVDSLPCRQAGGSAAGMTNEGSKMTLFLHWLIAHAIIFLGFHWWLEALLFKVEIGHQVLFGLRRALPISRNFDIFESTIHKLIWTNPQDKLLRPEFLALALAIAVICFVCVNLLKKITNHNEKQREALIAPLNFILWMVFIPIFCFISTDPSLPYKPITQAHVILSSIMIVYCLCAFISLLSLRLSLLVLSVVCVSLIPHIALIVGNDAVWSDVHRTKDIAEFTNKYEKKGDLVLTMGAYARTNFSHYLRDDIPIYSLLPATYVDFDIWATRHTLGFMENEYQSRISPIDLNEFRNKLNYIDKKFKPQRIWFYYTMKDDPAINSWLQERHWKLVYYESFPESKTNLYLLYQRPRVEKKK